MKILGISGSPREDSVTARLVQEVLAGAEAECETEYISLAGKRVGPCIACLGCVQDNVCKVKDDLAGMRESIVSADAYVIGAANYYNVLNGLAHCFLERWYQFRHREGKALSGRLAVVVGVGGGMPAPPVEGIKGFLQYNQIECVAEVTAQGPACCFTCGYGEGCKVGAIHMFFGAGTKITPSMIPSLEKQPEAVAAARAAGRTLSKRLTTLGMAN